ncbi:MAG: Glycosyltransferase (Modular protein) [Candidatus Uhrbacteria bacterium GW2011_GWA2_52_8d]|uniref:Glycosyltransferase (Modular protein) n=1 Tax=Candidatus Uhrbacteria bacterium GW2011_GWA2_52_8d TaxID=1618979 RepID=A0A0G1ZRV9_9BACT|nr:MAG: Glycosyltransferase (Modular protein) [Candidatus Uhrbacteria bacterium GW2011_GWA2_52_8d]
MDLKQATIAHVVCTYPPYRGGMGHVAFEYVERLRARGYNVHVFTIQDSQVENDPRHIHRIPPILHIGNAGVLPSLFHRLAGFDLVHLHYPFFGGAEPVIVRKAMRPDQGLVMTYHMDAAADGMKGAIFSAHRRLLFPWLVNRVDRILVSSLDYAKHSALSELEVDDRLEEHPFGVDLERFHPGEETDLRERYGIPYKKPVLLFVGGLDPAHAFKGLSLLLDTLVLVQEYDWHLVVVGDGNLKKTYRAQVHDKGLESRITFAGNVSQEDLPRYYRLADMHLFPSTKRAEAFGLVALEAAASGIPTIASDLPGVRTVVLDGSTGLLVPPGNVEELKNAILLFLEQVDLRHRLGLCAQMNASQKYAWSPLIDRLESTYDSVLNQQSKRHY